MLIRHVLVATVAVTGCLFHPAESLAQSPRAGDVRISIAEIGSRVKVVGRLGMPLEEMMSVRGVWEPTRGYENVRTPPPSKLSLRVTYINGKPLAAAVLFMDIDVREFLERNEQQRHSPQAGATWEFRACETAHFAGTGVAQPNEFRSELLDIPGYEQQAAGHLRSQLLVVWRSVRISASPADVKSKDGQ